MRGPGMRILILSNLCPPLAIGGYEIACLQVAKGLAARGHEIVLATSRSHLPAPEEAGFVERAFGLEWFTPSTEGVTALHDFRLFQAGVSSLANTAALLRLLRDLGPDVAYVWNLFGLGGIALLDLLDLAGVPRLLHLMDDMGHQLLTRAPRHVLTLYGGSARDLVADSPAIVMSERLAEEMRSGSGVAFATQEIVPGWVDTTRLPDAASREPAPTRFVTAARIEVHKGIHLILEAAAMLRAEGAPAFTVDLFGQGNVAGYVDQADGLGLSGIVRFHGHRAAPELLAAYARSHAFLFPTWEREPFGLAPIEAAACGCVPILTRQCGAAERLVDEAHCIKIDRSAEELAAAMRRVMAEPEAIARMGARARAAVRRDLCFDRALDRIESVLDRVARLWSRARLDDPRLPLLLNTKHELALSLMFR
jgi:glycosyltransferase involved in cell wall biosynthesis